VLEAVKEERMHMGEVTRVLVRRPAARRGATLEDVHRNFAHEGYDYLGRPGERGDDGSGVLQL
jgi:hypothetical protein